MVYFLHITQSTTSSSSDTSPIPSSSVFSTAVFLDGTAITSSSRSCFTGFSDESFFCACFITCLLLMRCSFSWFFDLNKKLQRYDPFFSFTIKRHRCFAFHMRCPSPINFQKWKMFLLFRSFLLRKKILLEVFSQNWHS